MAKNTIRLKDKVRPKTDSVLVKYYKDDATYYTDTEFKDGVRAPVFLSSAESLRLLKWGAKREGYRLVKEASDGE